MYGIFTYIWHPFMVNVGKYSSSHGASSGTIIITIHPHHPPNLPKIRLELRFDILFKTTDTHHGNGILFLPLRQHLRFLIQRGLGFPKGIGFFFGGGAGYIGASEANLV